MHSTTCGGHQHTECKSSCSDLLQECSVIVIVTSKTQPEAPTSCLEPSGPPTASSEACVAIIDLHSNHGSACTSDLQQVLECNFALLIKSHHTEVIPETVVYSGVSDVGDHPPMLNNISVTRNFLKMINIRLKTKLLLKWNYCNKGQAFRKALLFLTAWENLLTLHTSFLLVLCCINLDNVWHLFYQLPARGKNWMKARSVLSKKEGLQMETLVVWRFFTVDIHPFTSLPNWWCWWKTSSLFKGH